jgi:hypothetical protein
MNAVQCRMARGALDWTTRRLATAAGVPVGLARDFQIGHAVKPGDVALMRKSFEDAGIVFVDDDGDGPGVLLMRSKADNLLGAAGATRAMTGAVGRRTR